MNNTILLCDIALKRSKRLYKISSKHLRPLTAKNIDAEIDANNDYFDAMDENHETSLEMIERFKV